MNTRLGGRRAANRGSGADSKIMGRESRGQPLGRRLSIKSVKAWKRRGVEVGGVGRDERMLLRTLIFSFGGSRRYYVSASQHGH